MFLMLPPFCGTYIGFSDLRNNKENNRKNRRAPSRTLYNILGPRNTSESQPPPITSPGPDMWRVTFW